MFYSETERRQWFLKKAEMLQNFIWILCFKYWFVKYLKVDETKRRPKLILLLGLPYKWLRKALKNSRSRVDEKLDFTLIDSTSQVSVLDKI